MAGHKNRIIVLITSIMFLYGVFTTHAMQRPFDAQNRLEALVYVKSIGGYNTYQEYSLDELKAVMSLVWRTLDPSQVVLLRGLAEKLGTTPHFAWEYLNDVRKELLTEIQRRSVIVPGIQPIPVSAIVSAPPIPFQPILPTLPIVQVPHSQYKVHLININNAREFIVAINQINANASLIQLKSVDQNKPSISEVFGGETCPIMALHNASSVLQYANTGDLNIIKNMSNEANAKQFLKKLGTCKKDWNRLTTQEIEMLFLAGIPQDLAKNIVVLDSVIELGNPQAGNVIYAKTSSILHDIRKGLRQDNFVYSLVLGDAEFTQFKLKPGITMHYISFSIIKSGNQVQYIVVDSLGNQSHLTGMRRMQIDYLIDLINNDFSNDRLSRYIRYLDTDARKEIQRQEEEYFQQLIKMYGTQGQP